MHKISRSNYYVQYMLLTLGMAGISGILFNTLLADYYFDAFPLIFAFIAAVTLIFHAVVKRYINHNMRKFQHAFLIGTTGKLLIYLVFIVVYIFVVNVKLISFVVSFFVLYIVYTFFETQKLFKRSKE